MTIITNLEHDEAGGVGTGRYVLAALLFLPIGLAVCRAHDRGDNDIRDGGFDTQECYRTASGQLVCP